MLQNKICTKCGRRKPLTDFSPSNTAKDECQSWCKECCSRMKREVRAGIYQYQQKEVLPEGLKRCTGCNKIKVLGAFGIDKRHKDGRRSECNDCRARYRVEHTEEIAKSKRHCHEKNPGKRATRRSRRRALKTGAEGSHTSEEFDALCKQHGQACLRCGTPHSVSPLTRDHIIPLSQGGPDDISNIQPLCLHCNDVKSTKTVDYRQGLGIAVSPGF